MEKIFKNIGFKNFIIKLALWIVISIGISIIAGLSISNTPFYKSFLDIPQEFYISFIGGRTLLINAFLFGLVAFVIFSHEKLENIKNFKFQKNQILFAFLAVISLIGFYIFKYLINRNVDFFLQEPILWGIIKIIITILFIIFTGMTVFGFPFIRYFLKNYRKEIGYFIIFTTGFFFLMLLVQNAWSYFSSSISEILYRVFSLFFDNVTYKPFVSSFTMSEGGGPLLGINNFSAIIGKPCSGIDSLLLFTSVFVLIMILDYKKINKVKATIAFIIGAVGMFIVNLVRILLLFIVGAYIDPKLAIGLFHTNIGWILFIIYGLTFYWIAFKFIYIKKPINKNKYKKK
jgi:exosortase/archaeosortase family protein